MKATVEKTELTCANPACKKVFFQRPKYIQRFIGAEHLSCSKECRDLYMKIRPMKPREEWVKKSSIPVAIKEEIPLLPVADSIYKKRFGSVPEATWANIKVQDDECTTA